MRFKNVLAFGSVFLVTVLSAVRFLSSDWVFVKIPVELWLVGFYVAVPAAAALVLAILFEEET